MSAIEVLKAFDISKKEKGIGLRDNGKHVHILTDSYGKVTSVVLNKSEIKRLINWLNKWVDK